MAKTTRCVLSVLFSSFLAGSMMVGHAHADAPATPPAAPVKAGPQPADQPAPKMRNGEIEPGFKSQHESFLRRGKEGKIGVLFLGDSITAGWTKAPDVWKKAYGSYDPANFGISGDRTQHVLWRIANGELDGIHPKVVVLMIGTNNSGEYTVAQITAADEKIISEIHEKLPDTKVLVLGIFPRGVDPENPAVAALREKLSAVNANLAKLDDGKSTRYLDIGGKFLNADGILRFSIMPDALHPSHKGYEIWAAAMQPLLDEMMK